MGLLMVGTVSEKASEMLVYAHETQHEKIIRKLTDQKEDIGGCNLGMDVLSYWPSCLFSYLADSASMIEWGGEVVNSKPYGDSMIEWGGEVVNSEPDGYKCRRRWAAARFPEEGFEKLTFFYLFHEFLIKH
ncbi:hypothetical protein L1987_13463 [Smallanthus sonchifolius]|uniref:Uncharacterized protein n=1 Tax=Smallanthus sonchifolius TaxID=185202 RepID=A0ACB9JGZ5_9ASTR|nr:hypothetical protein L1987_13463 [Smallanthus sonchifolius]